MAKTNVDQPQFRYISPTLLDFDPNNPRFSDDTTRLSQDKIQNLLFGEPYYASELVDSFLENGFIDYEPLVVKHGSNGRFTVIEGNRRLAAIKHILSKPGYPRETVDELTEIPVLIFPKKSTVNQEDEMRVYLGVRHLLGFREWPPLSKAQFLDRESKRAGGLDRILKETRLTKTAAKRFLIPLRVLRMAKERIPEGEDFSNLGEALGRSGTPAFLELEIDQKTLEVISFNKRKFAQLLDDLYGKKVPGGGRDATTKVVSDTREISSYSKVLGSDKASSILHSGKTLAEAEIYVDSSEESLKRLNKATQQIGSLLKKIIAGKKSPEDLRILDSYKKFDAEVKRFINVKF